MTEYNLSDKILNDIKTFDDGTIFSINDFYHEGTKNTIKSILFRLEKKKEIVRLIDGMYTKPKFSNILSEYSYPTITEIANKIAEKFSWTICPSKDHALNLIGLSTQVPNDFIYISDGPYREYEYRGKKLIFKHSSNRFITDYSYILSLSVQSIKAIGRDNITDDDIIKIACFWKIHNDKSTENTSKLPVWINEVFNKITKEKDKL